MPILRITDWTSRNFTIKFFKFLASIDRSRQILLETLRSNFVTTSRSHKVY